MQKYRQTSLLWLAIIAVFVSAINGQEKVEIVTQKEVVQPLINSEQLVHATDSNVTAIVNEPIAAPDVVPDNEIVKETVVKEEQVRFECDPENIAFELQTGYILPTTKHISNVISQSLMLADCLEACQADSTCRSINFETGLCTLLNTDADLQKGALTRSQYPVFTTYAQKTCLGIKPCEKAWCIDRVDNYRLNVQPLINYTVNTRQECIEMCLGEESFVCRSVNYNRETNVCELLKLDRSTADSATVQFVPSIGSDFMENNCVEEPTKLCEFKKIKGSVIKTVDSLFQEVASIEECRELCLNAPYRCRSYDYESTGKMVCRLSHHSRATLQDIEEPYLHIPETDTYELQSCYNISIKCGATEMQASIHTNKVFDGKVYVKGNPNTCMNDIRGDLEFNLRMPYDDLDCKVQRSENGKYVNNIIIQHHDKIITRSDLALAVTCRFDLTNKKVTNEVDLGVKGDVEPTMTEEVIVESPNVAMKITDRNGNDAVPTAEVGDALALRFEIIDHSSPYEIFVRELIAMDGVDSNEIVLIDSRGCPADEYIMGPIYKHSDSGKILISKFDAFKFPSSDIVQFRALVTPCIPSCEPVQCDQEDEQSGQLISRVSYGKKRRRRHASTAAYYSSSQNHKNNNNSTDDMLLVQTIHITDKFSYDNKNAKKAPNASTTTNPDATYYLNDEFNSNGSGSGSGTTLNTLCLNMTGIIGFAVAFLILQLVLLVFWMLASQKRHQQQLELQQQQMFYERMAMGSTTGTGLGLGLGLGSTATINIPSNLNDSLCKLYDGSHTSSKQFQARRF